MDTKKWICTSAFSYAGIVYTVWIKPAFKTDSNKYHIESKVEISPPDEAKKALSEHGFEYVTGLNNFL